jgi:hypothetical protein
VRDERSEVSMREVRIEDKFLVMEFEWKRSLGRPKRNRDGIIILKCSLEKHV